MPALAARPGEEPGDHYSALIQELRGFLTSMTGDSDVADDIVGEVMEAVYDARAKGVVIGNLHAWSFIVARRRFLAFLRRRQRRMPLSDGDVAEVGTEDSGRTDALAGLVRDEDLSRLRLCLVNLPAEDCDFILRAYGEGKNPALRAILAKDYDLSPNALYKRMQRIRDLLRTCMGMRAERKP